LQYYNIHNSTENHQGFELEKKERGEEEQEARINLIR
jgi:hypothetical protein